MTDTGTWDEPGDTWDNPAETWDSDLAPALPVVDDAEEDPADFVPSSGSSLAELVIASTVVINEVIVLQDGIVVDTIAEVLPGGYITLDTTAENIRTITFSCLDENGFLTPVGNGGQLQPNGTEIKVGLGFIIEGVPVLWPQGVYGVQETDVSTSAGSTDSGAGNFPGPGPNLTITAIDRSNRIAINLFEDTFTIPAGTPMDEAIELILESQAPWCVNPNITPTEFEVAQQVFSPGDDPWQDIVAIAAAGGMVAYFDANGVLVVRPAPSLAGTPVSVALVDGPGQLCLSVTGIFSNNPGYNGVTVVNTSSAGSGGVETQLSGSAFDMNPASPTYALGPYGMRPAPPVTVTTATTSAQCKTMAQALLPQVLGMSNSVVADNIPVPQLEAYALVYIQNGASEINETMILQQATLYLDYTEAETITLVPLGAPITDLAYLKGPSQAQFGSANPYFAGAGQVGYTPGAPYTYSTYGSSSSKSTEAREVAEGAFRLLYVGDRIVRVFHGGLGDSGIDDSDDEDVVDDAEDVL